MHGRRSLSAIALAAGLVLVAGPSGHAQDGEGTITAAGFSASGTPKIDRTRDSRGRYAFTLRGRLRPSDTESEKGYIIFPPGSTDPRYAVDVPRGQICVGPVRITIERPLRRRGRVVFVRLLRTTVRINSRTCTWRATYRTTRRNTRFRVQARFGGNDILRPRTAPRFTLRSVTPARRR